MPDPSSLESDFDSSLKAGHTREYAFHARRNAHEEKEYGKEEESFAPGELRQNDESGFSQYALADLPRARKNLS